MNKTEQRTPNVEAQGTGGRIINLPLAAGAVTRITSRGTKAYLVIATATVNMRPDGGDFVAYSQGTGIHTREAFSLVEIENPNAVAVVISIWVGFDDFIDNRLILANATLQNVTYPTQPLPTATRINIPDLSGGFFVDINGGIWIALFRQAIIISNLDPATPLLLQKFTTATGNGPSVLNIPPGLPIAHNSSGSFAIYTGGATISAIVSEIYQAIPAP